MRLALMIEGQEDVSWTQWLALAEACEASGVEALFRSDHYLSASDEGRHVPDAWATIAALAARTSTLELGTLVSPATFRHPAVLARLAASADEIAGGRVTLGIGTGWAAREHEAYGIGFFDDRRRVERFREQVEIIHRLLREERVDYRGTHYALHEAPGLVRPAMPIIVGGRARSGTARAAARFADEYNTFFATLTEARERKRALDEECARTDRDPATLRYSLMAPCIIGPDVGTVRESANRIGARLALAEPMRCSSVPASSAPSERSSKLSPGFTQSRRWATSA
jgi:alkanesulfonate monooxygenase SsuD/methylene tetrahydromethanopterin reductase-like flavin-dependent oxidoreductase (luciferase family)